MQKKTSKKKEIDLPHGYISCPPSPSSPSLPLSLLPLLLDYLLKLYLQKTLKILILPTQILIQDHCPIVFSMMAIKVYTPIKEDLLVVSVSLTLLSSSLLSSRYLPY